MQAGPGRTSVWLAGLLLLGSACAEIPAMSDEGKPTGEAQEVSGSFDMDLEKLKTDLAELSPQLTGTRSVEAWTGVKLVGSQLLIGEVDGGRDAALAALSADLPDQVAETEPVSDKSAARMSSAVRSLDVTEADEADALDRLGSTLADFARRHPDVTVTDVRMRSDTVRQSGVLLESPAAAKSFWVVRRVTALTAHSR